MGEVLESLQYIFFRPKMEDKKYQKRNYCWLIFDIFANFGLSQII